MTTRVYAKRKCPHCDREIAVVTFPQHMMAKHPDKLLETPSTIPPILGEIDGAVPVVKRES